LNQNFIQQFYRDYHARLIKFAQALMHSQENAEEAVHNVFRKLWDSAKLDEIKNPYAYLVQCTKFEAYALLAKEKKTREVNHQFFRNEIESVDTAQDLEEELSQLKQAMKSLPAKCKEIMFLKIEDGLTHQEIAEYLEISEKTVENQVTIAIKKIRKYITKA